MTRSLNTFKHIAYLVTGLSAWVVFSAYAIQASALPMIDAVKHMA